jgi:hypothetical protein
MAKRWTILATLALLTHARLADAAESAIDPATAKADRDGKVLWYDIRALEIEGQGWRDTKAPFDRLPAKAEGAVRPPVWALSRQSAGLCVRFITDATAIQARWTLTSDQLAMAHMPAVGVSGLDLYTRPANGGRWQWLGVGIPRQKTTTTFLVAGLPEGKREFLLYLPLYNGVTSVEIGLPKGAALAKTPPRPAGHARPVVFYGTSITQGGCASRPGMVHTAIIGRKLDMPVINLGFSGNGTMDESITRLVAELDAAAYVIDCLPNLNAAQIGERTEPLVRGLRKARPATPILLVEDRTYANAPLLPAVATRNRESRAAFKAAYERLLADKVPGLFYLRGDHLIGDDGEGTVDSSHPTDLGFLRQAEAFLEVLGPALMQTR